MLEKKHKMRIVNRNYRHKLEIWSLGREVENEVGEIELVEEKLYDLWGEVIPIRGKEYALLDKLVPEMDYKINTRYRPDIDQSMIIKWGDKRLNIKAIVDINGLEEHMEIMCTEKVEVNV